MRYVIALLLALGLASCVHTAVAPLSTPGGELIVIRVPGVAKGGKAKQSQVLAIDETLLEGVTEQTIVWRYFPDLEGRVTVEAAMMGIVGEVQTKRGATIHGYVPLLVLRADAPAARVEEAATKMAADLYKRARKTCEVYPASQIADRPKR